MLADREHLARCNLRWPRHSELEVTGSAGLIVEQQALFLLHTDSHAHTHAWAHILIHKCVCVPTVAAGLWVDVYQLVKQGCQSVLTAYQRSNRITVIQSKLGPLTGSATLHKSNSDSMHTDSAKYGKTTEEHGFDLHSQKLTLKMLKNALTCVQMRKKKELTLHVFLTQSQAYTEISEQLWHLELYSVGARPTPAISPTLRTHVPYWVDVKQHLIIPQPASVCLRLWFVEMAVLIALLRLTNRWTMIG